MTKEEAIKILSKVTLAYEIGKVTITQKEINEALDMAIKALEQTELNPSYNSVKTELKLCEDCISRKRLLARIDEERKHLLNIKMDGAEHIIVHHARRIIEDMPPVTPQPKAEWIPCSERLPDTDDKVLCWYEYYHWSREKVLPEYGIGCYLRKTSAWFGEVANGKDVKVIAWMPLPEPYKENQG